MPLPSGNEKWLKPAEKPRGNAVTRYISGSPRRCAQLSAREIDVLLCIGWQRYLYRSHLEAFVFEGAGLTPRSREVVTERVLRSLKLRGLVGATARVVDGLQRGSAPPAYFLTDAGYQLTAAFDPGLTARRPPFRGTVFMAHALTTADIALALRRSARAYPGHALIEWECDWQAAERLGTSLVVPDAHFAYRTATCVIDALLEVDLGTERASRFARKVEAYLDVYRDGSWRTMLKTWPLVLTVTPDEERATALRRTTEALLSSSPEAESTADATEFAFTSLPTLLGPLGPLGKIWRVAGKSGVRSVIPEGHE